jgi:phage baseplate assembly protein W
MVGDDMDIEESIRIVLGTAKGERRMRPTFGSSLHELVFAPNNASTATLASHYVREALGQWEPRIEVTEVGVTTDPLDPACLLIDVRYRIRETNDERNLVYPFYRIIEEG